jgi:hypothetical protein
MGCLEAVTKFFCIFFQLFFTELQDSILNYEMINSFPIPLDSSFAMLIHLIRNYSPVHNKLGS